ncbi:MAG: hypothetical protein LUD73_02670, partial [Lachnospiraceae bacterium]|nr:hypothetical protein [Lachnospiraceae bacterium]
MLKNGRKRKWMIGIVLVGIFMLAGSLLLLHRQQDNRADNDTNDTYEAVLAGDENKDVLVMEPDWESIDTAILDSDDYADAEPLIETIRLNTRYLLNTWWTMERVAAYSTSNLNNLQELTEEQQEEVTKSRESFISWRDTDYLYLVNAYSSDYTQNAIRPLSHACMTLAIALRFHIYDEDVANVSYEDALAMTVKLISSVARMHGSNTDTGGGWEWQSAVWAEETGFAAWLLYSELDEEAQGYVVNMLISEADAVSVDYEASYYMDVNGNVLYEGDTKAEENAFESRILALASCMFPEHSHQEIWTEKLYELLLASTARPSDVGSSEVVDGFVLGEVLNGSNINEDGTVINHNKYHIDYMVSETEGMLETAIVFALAGKAVPESSIFNLDVIYDALVNLDIGKYDETKEGHHFYERDEEGNASYLTNM